MNATNDPHYARRWLVLGVLGIAQLMVVLDSTIVNIALPSAKEDLGFSDESRQWVITAYALAFGSLLLLGGRIGDLFGRRRVFVVGLIGFAVASAIGGAAGSFGLLVASRVLQGVFGALLAPAALGILSTTFVDPVERGKAFGIFGAIAGSGAAVGLLLGGVLTEWLSWRWCLYVNLLFALPAAVAAMRILAHDRPSERPRLDIPGTVAATAGLFLLVFGFSHAETDGWGDPLTSVYLGVGAALLVAFVAIQRTVAHPLLPLRVVLDRARGGAYLAIGISGAAMFGVFLFLTFFLQQTLGFSPIQTGLGFLPMSAAIMITATTVSARVLPRTGARPLVPVGMMLGAVAMVAFAFADADTHYATGILPGLLVMGVGMGLIFAPSFYGATLGVAPHDAGVASATVNTAQQVGGSVGLAFLSTMVTSATTSYASSHSGSASVVADAAVHGYSTGFWWSAGIYFVGAIIVGLILPSGVPAGHEEEATAPAMAH